jgi:hypothetical protein
VPEYDFDAYRAPYPSLPPTAVPAFRFHQGHKLLLYSQGLIYEGDLIEPTRWAHVPPGLRVFVRLPGGLDSAPIVGALVLANALNSRASANGYDRLLSLDLNPDRPPGQEPAEGEVVHWHRSQFQTLFVYWERAAKAAPKRDA